MRIQKIIIAGIKIIHGEKVHFRLLDWGKVTVLIRLEDSSLLAAVQIYKEKA